MGKPTESIKRRLHSSNNKNLFHYVPSRRQQDKLLIKPTWLKEVKKCKFGQVLGVKIDPRVQDPPDPMDHLNARLSPIEETEQIELIQGDAKKVVNIGTGLNETLRASLIQLLREYTDIFAWVASDMTEMDEFVVVYY